MKEIKEAVGIDVSKATIDVHVHRKNEYSQFENSKNGFADFLRWTKQVTRLKLDELFFCFEYTGIYSFHLGEFLHKNEVQYSVVPAVHIKRSLGITRGKNDRVDARRIAEFAYLRRETLKRSVPLPQSLLKVKQLLALRDRLVVQRAGFKGSLREIKAVFKKQENEELFTILGKMTEQLTKQIVVIEKKIRELIKADDDLNELFKLITSVKGVGEIIAAQLLVTTNCFEKFQNSRQMACYCGVAPFGRQSGTSLNSKARVNHFANKKMKTLLNLAASTAIQFDPELKAYYERRVKIGKSKMSTLNIVRNKILHRVFAVVKRRTPFVNIAKWAA